MSLTTAEIESVRHHLGWGNISVAAYPYTPDGFYEVFNQIVSPNLSVDTETTSTTSVTAAGNATLTLGVVTNITANTRLLVDVGDAAEIVTVRSVSGLTVTAAFTKVHAQPYPVAVMCGVARLRMLIYSADTAWSKLQSASVTGTSGIKQLGQGEIEWFSPSAVYQSVLTHYLGICMQLSSLVRVPMNDESRSRGSAQLEVY